MAMVKVTLEKGSATDSSALVTVTCSGSAMEWATATDWARVTGSGKVMAMGSDLVEAVAQSLLRIHEASCERCSTARLDQQQSGQDTTDVVRQLIDRLGRSSPPVAR